MAAHHDPEDQVLINLRSVLDWRMRGKKCAPLTNHMVLSTVSLCRTSVKDLLKSWTGKNPKKLFLLNFVLRLKRTME